MRVRWFRGWIGSIAFAVLCGASTASAADTRAIIRSLLLPGSGQAQQGHYTKAAIFSGAAVVTGVGLVLSQVHYNQAVERFNGLRETYVGYEGNLQEGTVVPYSEITGTYSDMQAAYDDSETRENWRNTFMVAFIVTYAANLVDVILSKEDTGEREREEAPVGMELRGNDIRLYGTFHF